MHSLSTRRLTVNHVSLFSCVVCRGRALSAVVVHCPLWLCVVRCGCASSAVVVRRPPWLCVVCRGCASSAMVARHPSWSCIAHCLPSLSVHGRLSFIAHCSAVVVRYPSSSIVHHRWSIHPSSIVVGRPSSCHWSPVVQRTLSVTCHPSLVSQPSTGTVDCQ